MEWPFAGNLGRTAKLARAPVRHCHRPRAAPHLRVDGALLDHTDADQPAARHLHGRQAALSFDSGRLLFYPTPLLGGRHRPDLALHPYPNFGLLNTLLNAIGLSGLTRGWLGDPSLAFYVIVGLISWQFIPFHALLYMGGARQIPRELYEAASIDGAGRVQQFFMITLPQLKYTLVTSTTLILTGSLTYFDLIWVTTGGGPGFATRVLPLQMYITAFQNEMVGYGSTLAVLLAVVGIVLSILLLRFSGFARMSSQREGL